MPYLEIRLADSDLSSSMMTTASAVVALPNASEIPHISGICLLTRDDGVCRARHAGHQCC